MAGQFANPDGAKLLAEVGSVFKTKPVFQRRPPHVLFACGGPVDPGSASMRREFIGWAKEALPDFLVIRAEDAFKEALIHHPPKFINLATFERLVAEISDCILIFPESAGSLAEVGYFSALKEVRNKVLVVNDRRFEAEDSFVTLGPLSTINADSYLQPTLHVASPGTGIDFSPLDKRLSRIRERSGRRWKLDHKPYRRLNYGEQFCVLLEIVRILRAVTLDGLNRTVREAFGRPQEVNVLLSVLVASGLITKRDEYFTPTKPPTSLLDIEDADINTVTARVLFYHSKHDPRAYRFAKS